MRVHFSLSGAVSGLIVSAAALVAASCSSPKPIHTDPPPSAGLEESPTTEYTYEHSVAPPKPPRGRRPVVALLRSGDLTELADSLPFGRQKVVVIEEEGQPRSVELQGEDLPVLLPIGVRQVLLKELVDSDELLVVDRERIFEILREQSFGQTRHVDPESAPKTQRLIGVHYILEGAFYPAGSEPATHSVWGEMGQFVSAERAAPDAVSRAVMYISAYHVETGMIVAIAFGADENHVFAVRKAVRDLLAQLGDTPPPIRVVGYDEHGNAILDIGSVDDIQPKDQFPGVSPTGKPVTLEAWQVDPLTCIAKFLTGDPDDLPAGSVVHRAPVRELKNATDPGG